MKDTRAKLIDFVANNQCKKEKADGIVWPFRCLVNFFLLVASWTINFFIVLLTIPFSIIYTPNQGFQKLGRRNGKGYFFDSYSRYLKFHKASVGTMVAIIVVVAAKVIFTFVAFYPEGTGAKGVDPSPHNPGCQDVTVYTNSPSFTQTINQGNTFTLAGHFCNTEIDGNCAVCEYDQVYTGQFRLNGGGWGMINTTTALKTNSSYTGTEGSGGDTSPSGCGCQIGGADWTKTITANTGSEGKVYEVRFRLQNGELSPLVYIYSNATTINVLPNTPTGFSHSTNSTSSITWSWADNSSNETGYYVQDGANTNMSTDLGASATSWQEGSLNANTQYTRHSNVYAASGHNNSNSASAYTAIETPSGIRAGATTNTSITVSASGSMSNLANGGSGLYFSETDSATNSGWTQTNSWQKTNLDPNTQYTFKVKARNGDQDETSETATTNIRTLSPTPAVSSARSTQTWYKTSSFTFSNDLPFGTGGVGYYTYTWKKSATHTFSGSETQWDSGDLSVTATSAGSWYLHLKSFNDDDVANGTLVYGPYYFDNVAPAITSYEPTLANTTTTSQAPVINVDFTKSGGNDTSDLSSFEIRSRTKKGPTQVYWTLVTENINAKTYSNNWTVSPTFFNSLREGTNIIDVRVTDEAGNVTTEEAVFHIIKDTLGPEISLIEADASTNSATLSWTTDEAATSQLEWGLTNALRYLTTETKEYVTNHLVNLTGLDENTTYHFKCHSTDQTDHEGTSNIYSFTTSESPALIISDVLVVDVSDISVVVTWTTDRAAASKVRYGTTTDFGTTAQNTEYLTDHSISISGLEPNTQYYYEVISWDVDGIYAYDSYATFTTGEEEEEEPAPAEDYGETIPEQEEITVNNTKLPSDSITKTESKPLIRRSAVTFEGKTTPLASVEVNLLTESASQVVTADDQGYWSATFTDLSLGEHKVVIEVTINNSIIDTDIGAFIVINPAATIVHPSEGLEVIEHKPIIKGLAKSGYKVKVYIDGVYNGYTTATTHESGTGSFAYTPFLDLTYGQHTLHTVSVDSQGNNSDVSDTISFSIVYPFVSPTVFDPIVDSTDPPQVTITGLAINGSTIYVYLDNQLHGTFEVADHASGTASFAYDISTNGDLTTGQHSIYLVACQNGSSSLPSRTISFTKPTTATVDLVDNFVYTVQANDSLWSIAQRYYGDGKRYTELIAKNKINYPSLADNPGVIKSSWVLAI